MAIIEVNHQALRSMAQAIDTYCEEQDRQMQTMDASVKDMLSSHWFGPDAMEFAKTWEGVDAGDSTAVKFRESLKKYADALTACASVYQKAQEDVYNLSCALPQY